MHTEPCVSLLHIASYFHFISSVIMLTIESCIHPELNSTMQNPLIGPCEKFSEDLNHSKINNFK